MLRDTLVGLIEPMRAARELNPLALFTEQKRPSDDRPPCLENPRPEGTESTLTENAASPFHAEPKHSHLYLSPRRYQRGGCRFLTCLYGGQSQATSILSPTSVAESTTYNRSFGSC